MVDVVVAGSNNDFSFAVSDFTNPASPTNVTTNPGLGGGCMVDASGSLAAIGDFNGSSVRLCDISNPAAPALQGTVNTGLSGIGAISMDGNHVLVGELNGLRAVLIDASVPANPSVISTINTGISSIASVGLSGTKGVAAGPNDGAFAVIDYTSPASPTVTKFSSGTGGVFFDNVTVDINSGKAAVGDNGSGAVHFFDVSSGTAVHLGSQNTIQSGVFSVSISGTTVAAASSNNVAISLISFQNPASPTETDLNTTGLTGGANVKLKGNRLVAGDILGTEVALFSVSGTTATALGKVNTTLASIVTVTFTSFAASTPVARITASVPNLAFGAVHTGLGKTLPITFSNTGTAPLTINNLHATTAQYVPAPSGNHTVAPGGNLAVNVTFTPPASASYPSTLTMATNDPANATFTIPLTGSGGLPHMVLPGPLGFGNVAVCLSHVLDATVGNTGPVDLDLTQIATSGAGFSESSGASLTVPAGGSGNVHVSFSPGATGPASGTLTFKSDDPTQPTASIALSGTGTPEPPPAMAVSPTSINFGAVPLQYFIGIAVNVSNTGPCEMLNATLTVAGADFVLTTGNPTTVPANNVPLNAAVAPGTSQSFTVVFAPAAAGTANGTLTITSNDPANPSISVPLTGNGVPVSPAAIELVLDRSGSMATAVSGGTRMTALQSAVGMFADLVIPSTGFEMGSVQFDDAFAVLTPRAAFDTTQQTAIKTGANTLTPRNLTSIGGGLNLGQQQLQPSTLPRKVAIVFTDGYQNSPPDIPSVEPGVLAAGTEVYAVGLGDPAYLSVADLSELAASSNGKFFQTTDPLVLRKQFVEILADAFRMNMAADPIITLNQGQHLDVPVEITQCEGRISFVLLWENMAAQVQFTVRAPDGTVFTPSAAVSNRLVRYTQRPGYRFYQIALPPGPGATIGPKQIGQWTMRIDPTFIPGGTTRASTNVMVDSALQMTATITANRIIDPILIRAQIVEHGTLVRDAKVMVRLTAPVQSLSQIVTPLVHQRALAADHHHIPPKLQILTKTHVTEHAAKFNEREYLLHVPAPGKDGVYHAQVNATGKACGGVFERYWSGSVYIGRGDKARSVGLR